MIEKLQKIEKRFLDLELLIIDPKNISNHKKYLELVKEYKNKNKILNLYNDYKKIISEILNTKKILLTEKDYEFKKIAKEEILILKKKKEKYKILLENMLVKTNPNDSKNIILEIRSGIGGNEAAIFAGDLFRMYTKFTEKKKWNLKLIDVTKGVFGGYKEIICNIEGKNVYKIMKYESGVHRVQRVPATETKGRIHTSAVTIVVLPEIDNVEVVINMNDIRKDTFCSSGPGGQSVNTTYSAIRLTHIPTGIVASCQDEKSQIKNFNKALKVIRSRIYQKKIQEQQKDITSERKSIVKTGDRADKIRTYNYPNNKVIDHRINHTIHDLTSFLDGNIDDLINLLKIEEGR